MPRRTYRDSATETPTPHSHTRGTSPDSPPRNTDQGTDALPRPVMVSTGTNPDARHPAFTSLPSDQELEEVMVSLDARWQGLLEMAGGRPHPEEDPVYAAEVESYTTALQIYEFVHLRHAAGRARLAADMETSKAEAAERLRHEAATSTAEVRLRSEETQAAVDALHAATQAAPAPPSTPTKVSRPALEPPLTPRARRAAAKLADRFEPAAAAETQPSTSSSTHGSSSSERSRDRDRDTRTDKKDKKVKDKDGKKTKKSSRR